MYLSPGPRKYISPCAALALSSLRARPAHRHLSVRGVTRLPSQNCIVLLTSFLFFIGDSSRPTLSQEIDIPLPIPVFTPPSAQLPPQPAPTPPGADVASQRTDSTQHAEDDPDYPMSSLTTYRASQPCLSDVASSQDTNITDAAGEDDPAAGTHVAPARKASGPDGSYLPICLYPLISIMLTTSPFLLPPPPHSQIQPITINMLPLFTQVRPCFIFII
jgi:hypothetical protein